MTRLSKIQKQIYSDLWNANQQDHTAAVGSETSHHKKERYQQIYEFMSEGISTIHDAGGGVGHFFEFLVNEHGNAFKNLEYSMSDLYEVYVQKFVSDHGELAFVHDLEAEPLAKSYDALVLSGVFHRASGEGHDADLSYFRTILANAWASTTKKLILNLPSPSADAPKEINFHITWEELIESVSSLSRFFVLSQSSALFETTICILKHDFVKTNNEVHEFEKYLR